MYEYFPNHEALLGALAQRYADELGGQAAPHAGCSPVSAVVDRLVRSGGIVQRSRTLAVGDWWLREGPLDLVRSEREHFTG